MSHRFPRPLLLLIALLLTATAVWTPAVAIAQDEETSAAESSPESVASAGWLQVAAVTCETSTGTSGVSIFLETEFVADDTCYDGWSAVWIDGIDYGAAAPVLELQLNAGSYTLMEPTSGASRVVDVYGDTVTVAYMVTAVAVVPVETAETAEEPAVAVETTTLSIQTHICDPAIQDTDALLALGGREARLAECPVATLPDNYAPDGTVTAGQTWFDLSLIDDSGFSAALSGGTFVPDAVCESDLGLQLSTDPYDNACFSTSSYQMAAPKSPLSLTLTAVPELHRFGYAETGDDVASAWVIDQAAGMAGADLSGSGETALLHIYLFVPPRLTIVQHVCGGEVTSADALQQMSGFLERVNTCPAVTGDTFGFDVTIADGWGVTHYLSSTAPHTQRFCEADLGFDFNGIEDNACLEMAAYGIDNVGRGAVEVYPALPEGYVLGGVDVTPGTNDGNTLLSVDQSTPAVALETTWDGNVILHLFAIPASPEPAPSATATATIQATATATATATPAASSSTPTATPAALETATATPTQPVTSTGGTGTVQLVALYCLGNQNSTTLTALSPGQQAGSGLLGGVCFAGEARMQITFAGRGPNGVTQLGRDGVAWVENAPASAASGEHMIVDVVSGRSTSFAIQANTVTRVILRVEAALGSTSAGTASESTRPGGGTTGVNPNDLIGMLVTDVLVTDELNYLDAGESTAGSFDSNSYTVDLLGGLAVDELMSVTTVPAVGNGEKAAHPAMNFWVVALLAAISLLIGCVMRQRPRIHGLPGD